jgi:hypothetical protein
MIEPDEPDGLRTLRSMAALCGRPVLAQYDRVDNWHVRAAYIGPPFDDTVWCWCEKAMPFSNRVGLFELATIPTYISPLHEFLTWESFYRRYGNFTTEAERAKWVSPTGGYAGGHFSAFFARPLPSSLNPLSFLQAGLARR